MFSRFKIVKYLYALLIITLLCTGDLSLVGSASILNDHVLQPKTLYPSTSTQTSPSPSAGLVIPLPVATSTPLPVATSTPLPVATSTSLSSTSPSGQAMPIGDITGWHQILADDFNGTELNTSNWYPYSGQPGGDPAGWWDPSHVSVSGSLLTLKGYYDVAAKPGVFVTGGIGAKIFQTYGKYEVRMRVDKGDGISAIALLWPEANVWPPEVDFYEDGGGIRTGMIATLHCGRTGTIIAR